MLSVVLFAVGFSAFAQNITVKGTVAANDGEPVVGAYVLVKGSTNGQLTDLDGAFSLANVPANGTLVVAFMGMKTVEVPASPQCIRRDGIGCRVSERSGRDRHGYFPREKGPGLCHAGCQQ